MTLPGDLTVDVAIIGGGFAGLAAARRLRELDPGLKIAVLEASRLAEGASGRNSGFMIDLPHELTSDDYAGHGDDRAVIALNRQAIAFAKGAVADYGIKADYFDPMGKVNGAASAKADALNRSYAEHLATMGEASEYLDAKAMTELTGSRHYVSGLYTPGTVMLQPAGFVRGFGEGLRAAGVGVWENTPVTRDGGRGRRLGADHGARARHGGQGHHGQQRACRKLWLCRKSADARVPLCLDDGRSAGCAVEKAGGPSALGRHAVRSDGHHDAAD